MVAEILQFIIFFKMAAIPHLGFVGYITQLFYGSLDFVWNNPGKPVPEETFTHSHLSWSPVIPYLLPLRGGMLAW